MGYLEPLAAQGRVGAVQFLEEESIPLTQPRGPRAGSGGEQMQNARCIAKVDIGINPGESGHHDVLDDLFPVDSLKLGWIDDGDNSQQIVESHELGPEPVTVVLDTWDCTEQ